MKAIILFIVLIIPVHFYLQGMQTVTTGFSEVAPHFYIVGEKEGDFEIILLSKIREYGNKYKYHLQNDKIDLGAEVTVEILETSSYRQRIRVKSLNTGIVESTYDVIGNEIIPIKSRVLFSMGYIFIYFIVFIASLILPQIISRLRKCLTNKDRCRAAGTLSGC